MPNRYPQSDIDMMARFLKESYAIEGIHSQVPMQDTLAALDFMINATTNVDRLATQLINWVDLVQPFAVLRTLTSQNVQVGNHVAPAGGMNIRIGFEQLIDATQQLPDEGKDVRVYNVHCRYQNLHPFTDGNGRSGRLLALRHAYQRDTHTFKQLTSLGWLHTWYYLSLANNDDRA